MSVSAISSTLSAAALAAQELAETAAETRVEAAKGDQQAVRKLAQVQPQDDAPKAEPPTSGNAPGATGKVLNVLA